MKYRTLRNKLLTVSLTGILLGAPALSQATTEFSRIFFFGDSLSDPGNLYALTGKTSQAPYHLIPDDAYSIGGHQFTNGKAWPQRFAQNVQFNNSGKAAMDAPGQNGNYAFAKARARTGSGSPAPDFSAQLGMYASHYTSADADALYVVQFGGNDIQDALVAAAKDKTGATSFAIIQAAVTQTLQNIHEMYTMGARKFLIVNVPDVSIAPAIRLAGVEGFANFLAVNYNMALEAGLSSLDGLTGISIQRFDFYALTQTIIGNPEEYGLTETMAPCLIFFVESDAHCSNPDEHFFWDGFHPTTVVHNVIGDAVTRAIGGH